MLLSEGQMSDYKGAALMIDAFPKTKVLLISGSLVRAQVRPPSLPTGLAHIDCLETAMSLAERTGGQWGMSPFEIGAPAVPRRNRASGRAAMLSHIIR